MADDSFGKIHLLLMQDCLPVGLAMVERARHGGPKKVAEVFTSSEQPFQDLRGEGEPAAKTLRESLDTFLPGLGNPVMSVKVAVDKEEVTSDEILDKQDLFNLLMRIETGLNALQDYLLDDSNETKSKPSMDS